MPPVLDPSKSKVDGLAFIGLSLCRKSELGHPDSKTHQTSFDFNDVIDRDYDFIFSTDDNGWLVGGGEFGHPKSYKLRAKDSAHVELMRIGTFEPEWGGIEMEVIVEAIQAGKIYIPQIEVLPTAVVKDSKLPPELEIRFDMEPSIPNFNDHLAPLPINWALRFVHNQLFRYFQFPSRFCPGAFHSTITRKAEFRSPLHRELYFKKCQDVIMKWRIDGPKPLNNGGWDIDGKELIDCPYTSGIWLFLDRDNITHFFPPNFFPPYNTPEKHRIIMEFLKDEWDEKTLSWKPVDTLNMESQGEKIEEETSLFFKLPEFCSPLWS